MTIKRLDITHSKIQEVIDDLNLIVTPPGAIIFFVVDPFELVEFCFPIDSTHDVDVDQIADSQAALYEVLYLRDTKPVLLPEYSDEITRYLEFLRYRADEIYSNLDLLEVLVKSGKMDLPVEKKPQNGDVAQQDEMLLDYLQGNFNLVLALAMGMYSFGADRFRELAKRLQPIDKLSEIDPRDAAAVNEIIKAYEVSEIGEYLSDHLERDIEQRNKWKNIDRAAHARQVKAARRDARVIDFLIYINDAIERAFNKQKIKRRYIFLYISSAIKTAHLFDLERVRNSLPVIARKKYPFWRSKSQAFALAFNKSGKPDQMEAMRETIQKLTRFREALQELSRLEAGNPGGMPEGDLHSRLVEVENFLHGRRDEIENLGLLSRIKTYQRLAENKPNSKELAPYHAFFQEIYYRQSLRGRALQRMATLENIVVTRSHFAAMVPQALQEQHWQAGDAGGPAALITSASQKLPTRPNLTSEEYKSIVSDILLCVRTPLAQKLRRAESFDAAYKKFLERDVLTEHPEEEHELVRTLLYLAMTNEEGIIKAYQLSKEQRSKSHCLEFTYLFIWAARLAQKYEDADEAACAAEEQTGADPRFPHGRGLNMFAWLKAGTNCPYTLRDVTEELKTALTLYQKDEALYVEELGAIYNSLAYFYSYDRYDDIYDLSTAQRYMSHLKDTVSKDQWDPIYPEYFHTEAHLSFELFKSKSNDRNSEPGFRKLLLSAREDIDSAIRLNNKPLYAQLKRDIKEALRHLKGELARQANEQA